MSTVTINPELADIIDAPGIENRLQACAAFKNALGADRRVLVIRNGVTVRNCTLSGIMQSSAGVITGLGITSDDLAAMSADLSTGSTILRVTGGGHSFEGSLGLVDSGATFTAPDSLTPTNGLAFVNINIPLRTDLGLGGAGEGVPFRVELEDWQSGTAGAKTSIYFDEDAGDIVWEYAERAAETGPVPYWRSTETFVHGTGGKAMEIGIHRTTIPAQCNDEANKPVYEVFGLLKPYGRWSGYPTMVGYVAGYDSTFLAPCKIRIYDGFDNELPIPFQMSDNLPLNSPQLGQTRNLTTRWRPFFNCGQMLYKSTNNLKLSGVARKIANGMVTGTMDRPGMARAPSASNRAIPAFGTGLQNTNGLGHWYYAPPESMTTAWGGYVQTDSFAVSWDTYDPTGNDYDGGRLGYRAMGFLCNEPGAPAMHDWNGPPGGYAHDRYFMPSPRAMYLTNPNGLRPQGSVPYKLLNYEYNKGYFHHAHHHITNVRTAATLPHELVAYGGYAYAYGHYTTQGPIFIPGHAEDRHINIFGAGDPLPRDHDGLLPFNGWENDIQHSYTSPAWFAIDYNSAAAVFSAMLRYNSNLMSFGGSGSPYYSYKSFIMQRTHAWRWHSQNLMWIVGSSHPALLSQAQIETRAVLEWESAYDEIIPGATQPGHADYNTPFNMGLRNFGIPAKEYINNGAGTHVLAAIDDAKLMYLAGVLATMENSGFTARLTALSTKAGAMIDFVKTCVHTYSVKQFAATHGRKLFWQPEQAGSNQMGPSVALNQPLTMYSGFDEWASLYAPVNGQADLVREANGDPHYVEREPYQHIWLQGIFLFRDSLGGESKWPNINATCAIAQEQLDFRANLFATNYYNGIYGDYEKLWPAAGIQLPRVA